MADKYYLNNRLKYHTASRVANQTGDSLAATFNPDGHIVRDTTVWTSQLSHFPLQSSKKNADPIGATDDLVEVFKTGFSLTQDTVAKQGKIYYVKNSDNIYSEQTPPEGTLAAKTWYEKIAEPAIPSAFWNGGKVWFNSAFPAVKLYEDVKMTPVAASLGQNMNSGTPTGNAYYQAYEILANSEDGITDAGEKNVRITEWVAPPAIIDPATGSPVAGYTGKQMLSRLLFTKISRLGPERQMGTSRRSLGICLYGWNFNI